MTETFYSLKIITVTLTFYHIYRINLYFLKQSVMMLIFLSEIKIAFQIHEK